MIRNGHSDSHHQKRDKFVKSINPNKYHRLLEDEIINL